MFFCMVPRGVPLDDETRRLVRRQIYENAQALFAAKGIVQTTMKEISDASGLGTATIYEYFRNKVDITNEYFAEEQKVLSALFDKVAGISNPMSALGVYLEGLAWFWHEHWGISQAVSREHCVLGPDVISGVQGIRRLQLYHLTTLLGRVSYEVKGIWVNIDIGAVILLDLLNRLGSRTQCSPSAEIAEQVMQLFFHGAKN